MPMLNKDNQEGYDIIFTKTPKSFSDKDGRTVQYIERCIVINNIAFKVNSRQADVFDLLFADDIEEKTMLDR